ncbi:MAG: methyltransferase domain-containing protein [Clostridiales bacterium]|nr:methyltransferase domain-containing protein [Clostridiales bacterium]
MVGKNMTEYLKKVASDDNSRESLIELKNCIKRGEYFPTSEDIDYLLKLLSLEDAKSRKNVAQILGMLKVQRAASPLYEALEKENVEYVKSAYIIALKDIDISRIRESLKKLRESLINTGVSDENKKHYNDQISAYNEILGANVGRHTFCGKEVLSEIILITPYGLGNVTAEAMITNFKRVLSIGVCARISNLDEIEKIRTYKELLFFVPNMKKLPNDPYKAAEIVAGGELKSFLCMRHKENTPWAFRLNLVGNFDDKKKSLFIKRFCGELERHSNGYFVNQPSDYELEIRLLENKEGSFTTMVKLSTIRDKRFEYRKETVAASIRPELAANVISIAADYLRSNIQVLDPFCGVGTMLIERYKYRKASPMYGVDTFGEAIEKAKINSTKAEVEAYYINKDYFDFKHDYSFDEIITNMPFSLDSEDYKKIEDIYKRFFDYSRKLLKRGSYVIIYSRNPDFARKYSEKYGYYTHKEVLVSARENSYVFIFQK